MTKFLLKVDDVFWDKWKETVPRNTSLNDYLVKLMNEDLKRRNNKNV